MDLHSEALRTFLLGPLEKQALRALWSRGSATLPDLLQDGEFRCHANTLRTTLERLCRKQFLIRFPEKGVFRYLPTCDETEFQRRAMVELIRALLAEEEDPVPCLAYLVDVIVDRKGHSVDELYSIIERKRRKFASA